MIFLKRQWPHIDSWEVTTPVAVLALNAYQSFWWITFDIPFS